MSSPKKNRNRYKMIYHFYRRPTFTSGLASLFDLYNVKSFQKIYLSSSDDFNIIANDFKDVGMDLKDSIDNYTKKSHALKKKRELDYSY